MNSIKHLKDVHKGQECILLNCGPSLNDFSEEKLKEISKDRVVIAVKQAYLKAPDIVDYHFWNCCNLPLPDKNGIHFDYGEDGPMVIASSNFAYGVRWSLFQKIDCFYRVPLFRLDGDNVFIANALNFENWTYTNNPVERPVGPGIMYETVVFALEHFGFSRVICIGWDLTYKQMKTGWNQDKTYEHFYDENSDVHNPGYILDWEVEATCKASEALYKWLLSKGTQLEIASNKSSLYEGIPRVKL